MVIDGDDKTPGTALLLAVAPAGRGRLTDATSVLAPLAAVPPSALTGTATATVVELADPLEPQTVLTRLRAVAATPGPLRLYLAGQLQLDRRQRLVHLALARTTPATVRYDGLPWHWLAGELSARSPGTTTVVVDLVADAETWQHLSGAGLGLGPGVPMFGRLAPPPARRATATPAYLKAMAEIWRSGARPQMDQLHEMAAARSGSEGARLFTAGPTGARAEQHERTPQHEPAAHRESAAQGEPVTRRERAPIPGQSDRRSAPAEAAAPAPDPHPAILSAAHAGRHTEAAAAAAAWESEALRAHGPGSAQALHWLEVRADLAHLAQDPGRSCELWMMAAGARLQGRPSADDPEVEAAVDRAHHEWQQITDVARARTLAPDLLELRRRVPGRQRGALQLLQQRLERLRVP
ncbi:hypothetical protein AB0M87_15755 [Streptomyces sp. NPDC051320]|uniref:hypothetical protein n=1 Tax=Streptomyces sp. NPDC051320 TaxID=3154644 RepID=UPI00343FC9DF